MLQVLSGNTPLANKYQDDDAFVRAVIEMGERPARRPILSPTGASWETVWDVAQRCWPALPDERSTMDAVVDQLQYASLTEVDPTEDDPEDSTSIPPLI